MTIAKWAFECRGKVPPGGRPGTMGLHHWRREPDRTATCIRCGETLTEAEADDCFREW